MLNLQHGHMVTNMIDKYIDHLKYTFTKDSGADDFDVILSVIPIGVIFTIVYTLIMESF